jgi:peptide/nickel transport system substrate-binding protein
MKTQRKKLNPFIVVIMITIICLTGILSGVSAQNIKKDDTLRILIWEGPDPVWPYKSKVYKDLEIFRIVYEPLASFDADDKLVPILAAEIPTRENGGLVADGKSVTWKLKRGVHWADRTLLTVDDVMFTYEHTMSSSPLVQKTFKARYAMVRDVEKIDDYTIKVNFKKPNPAWAIPFTGRYGMILPRHILQAYTKADSLQSPGPKWCRRSTINEK